MLLDFPYEIIDITPRISEKMAVFPGDAGFQRTMTMDFGKGDHLGLSQISTTLHLGAHTDAPNHYHAKGVGIDQRPLDLYLGPCQVIEIKKFDKGLITSQIIEDVKIDSPRVLFKTKTFPNPDQWNDDFAAIHPELIDLLAEQGVRLVGIDTPSVDPYDSKDLHMATRPKLLEIADGEQQNFDAL